MGVGGQRHAPAALPLGKTRYPLCRRLGGPQGRSGRVQKISPLPGFDPRTVQLYRLSYPGTLPIEGRIIIKNNNNNNNNNKGIIILVSWHNDCRGLYQVIVGVTVWRNWEEPQKCVLYTFFSPLPIWTVNCNEERDREREREKKKRWRWRLQTCSIFVCNAKKAN
jgi:hypothetical protein